MNIRIINNHDAVKKKNNLWCSFQTLGTYGFKKNFFFWSFVKSCIDFSGYVGRKGLWGKERREWS